MWPNVKKNNTKRSESEQAKTQWASDWRTWYNSLPISERVKIANKGTGKRRKNFKSELEDIRRMKKELGL